MIIQKIETWWVRRNKCLFDDKRKGKSAMDWDVLVLKLTTDNGIEGIATALAARSGNVTEAYIPWSYRCGSLGHLFQSCRSTAISVYWCLPRTLTRLCQWSLPHL